MPNVGMILDGGCGIGSFERRLRDLNIVELDINRNMLKEAHERTTAPLVTGDARILPYHPTRLVG